MDGRPRLPPRVDFVAGLRASLNAKLERLLARPIIARVVDASADDARDVDELPDAFRALRTAAQTYRTSGTSAWREAEDGTCTVRIWLDYEDVCRGCEKEILTTIGSTVESPVTFLTEHQKLLLERSPREFLALAPPPESAELIAFRTEDIGGSRRVVELTLAASPVSGAHVRHVAIVPNLVQIERQLDALHRVETASDDGPLAPLKALVGACEPAMFSSSSEHDLVGCDAPPLDERLDEYQAACARKALATPHFSVIEGPPGSGKTTVITSIIRSALARGDRVLVVSPTHVAVDNVVEKLAPRVGALRDLLEIHSLPVRYAARVDRVSARASESWVGAKQQYRARAIARRVEARLNATVPFADALFRAMDPDAEGRAPLSSAIAGVERVICGTPIGVLSHQSVRDADPGSFGLLVVDEVSKMTLSEFLAIAVKARRWVVVGDPAQLPPYNDAEENATTLNDVVPPLLELACSVGAILERTRPALRHQERLVVASSDPVRAAALIRAHLASVMPRGVPAVGLVDDEPIPGIVVCSPADVEKSCVSLRRSRARLPDTGPSQLLRVLVEQGIAVSRPPAASGTRLVAQRERAHACVFDNAFRVYHAQPWSVRSRQRLPFLAFRNGLEKALPSVGAIEALGGTCTLPGCRDEMLYGFAVRFAINAISVYDWLTGVPASTFDTSPLVELRHLNLVQLQDAVRPFVGSLKKQYRMHASLSRVPRELFYFGEALLDGSLDDAAGCRVMLLQVAADSEERESNPREVDAVCHLLEQLGMDDSAKARAPSVMVITPYRQQETALRAAIAGLQQRGATRALEVDLCTLDRCQGREAEYVLVSLVRGQATPFLDLPNRWNVALTRARQGLFIIGDVDAYLSEAANARRELNRYANGRGVHVPAGETRPRMSLLARIIEAYERQIRDERRLP